MQVPARATFPCTTVASMGGKPANITLSEGSKHTPLDEFVGQRTLCFRRLLESRIVGQQS